MKFLVICSFIFSGFLASASEVQTHEIKTRSRSNWPGAAKSLAAQKKQTEVRATIKDCENIHGEAKVIESWTKVSRISKRSYVGRSYAIVTCTLP